MKPTAAPAYWPYPHRTMAQVMAEEHMEAVSYRASLQRACPACNAAPGVRCKTVGGQTDMSGSLHDARRQG